MLNLFLQFNWFQKTVLLKRKYDKTILTDTDSEGTVVVKVVTVDGTEVDVEGVDGTLVSVDGTEVDVNSVAGTLVKVVGT